ncbi:MAG TPA: LuxR C-terminal-related transcriptional regulator [Acidimicrobiales bacterium]|nr:LuxR C-terminal-related transcriptional regulator [Acidimicrobiales bacterium]
MAALDRATLRKVTVISAPPGSGKTSLLRAWSDRASKDLRVAFVSVPPDQQDAQQFWLAVLDAIRQTGAIADSRMPAAAPDVDGDVLVDTVVSELVSAAGVVVLVIDDLHELSSAEALSQLEHLLSDLPKAARVVLSSRHDPPIRLHRVRLADEVAELRAGDLRFTASETRELLAASEINLSDYGATALYERTEGWAAGVRLAVISLSGHPEPERFVAEFSGTDRAIGEYLMAEMLERQPLEVQGMLLRTSVVDRLNGELADLLAGRPGCEQMLLALEDANAFVVSLDAQRTWFRYHQLLADFLRLELRRTLAEEVPDLHRKAAAWLAEHGEVVDAIRHTLAAGNWPEAAGLLADHLFSLTLDGQEASIAALLRSFPAAASADHPELALAHAATQLAQGRLAEASAQLVVAESHMDTAPPARRQRLVIANASLRLALARRSGQFAEVVEQVKELDTATSDGSNDRIGMDTELRAVALMNLGIVETWSGRFVDADRHVTEGATLAQTIGRPYIEVTCRAYQAFPSPLISLRNAHERGREALALADRYGLSDRPMVAPALGSVASIEVWMGEFEEGERWLRRGWEVVQPDVDPAAAVLLHMVTGMLHAGRGEHQLALEALTAAVEARSLLTGVPFLAPVLADWLAGAQARLGMPDEARATVDRFSAEREQMDGIDTDLKPLVRRPSLAQAVISLEEKDPATALVVLGDVRDFTPPPGFPAYALVEGHVLAGLAHLALRDRSAAVAAAEAALAAAEPDRLIFPFAMHHAGELLDVLPLHQTAHSALLADVVDLLRGALAPRIDQERLPPPEQLSPSELRVLRFLPTNLTRPEIARSLHVSINTVNTHVSSIYSKLGASDRSSAVRRARELRLLAIGRAPS